MRRNPTVTLTVSDRLVQTWHGRRDARAQRRSSTDRLPQLATLHGKCLAAVESARRSMLADTELERVRLAVLRAGGSAEVTELARYEARIEQRVRAAQTAARLAAALMRVRTAVYSRALERRGGSWDPAAAELALPGWVSAVDPWEAVREREAPPRPERPAEQFRANSGGHRGS